MTTLEFWQAIYIEAYKLRGISLAKDEADLALKQLEESWEMDDTIIVDDTPPQYPQKSPNNYYKTGDSLPSTMEEYDNMPQSIGSGKIKKIWDTIRW